MTYAQWNPNTTYIVNDIVEYNGFTYKATVINQNVSPQPTTATWALIGGSGGGGLVNSITAGNPVTLDLSASGGGESGIQGEDGKVVTFLV